MFAPKVATAQTKESTISTSNSVRRHPTLLARGPGHGPAEEVLMLQRTLGDHATLPLLAQRGSTPSREPACDDREDGIPERTTLMTPHGALRNFSNIPVFGLAQANRPLASFPAAAFRPPGFIQPKLVVGEVNDPLEREADRVADQVMRMPAPVRTDGGATLQPKCAACEETERTETLRAKQGDVHESSGAEAPAIVEEVLRSTGEPLDAPTRAFFEPRFGRDFSQVRVHADDRAAESAHGVGALAYAVGPHIAFARGRYAPASRTGQALLAHELGHVVQQHSASRNDRSIGSNVVHRVAAVDDAAEATLLIVLANCVSGALVTAGYRRIIPSWKVASEGW
jgi:hypothetical protein